MSLPDIGFGSKTNHDQLGGATYPRYMVMYAERKQTSDSTPNDEDPIFGFRGATTHTTGTEAKVYMGILNGVLPSPEHNVTVSNLSAGIVGETDRVIVHPGVVLNPTTTTIAPDTKGSIMYDSGSDELKYYDGAWQIVSAGGLSAHALDGAYHTATGLTVGWVISADSATTFSWKAPASGSDDDAIHDNVANEITAITPKTTLGSTDEFVLEDGGASFVKKAVTFANIESSISLANLGTRTHASLSDAPENAHHNKNHALIDTTGHTVAGLTPGNFLKAITATTYGFQAHGLTEGGAGTDTTAIHDNVANEIGVITTKTSLVAGDVFIIEDSGATYAKKSTKFTDIESSLDLGNLGTRTHASLSDAPSSAHHVRYADSEVEAVITAELVDGQSIDNAIDTLIETHRAKPSDHHALVTVTADPLTLSGQAITFNYHADYFSIGSSNDLKVGTDTPALTEVLTWSSGGAVWSPSTPAAHVLATTGPHTGTLPWSDLNKTGSSLADLATRTHASLSDAPADAHHVAFVLSDFTTAFAAESLANLTTRTHASLSDAPTDAHHNEAHTMNSHTFTSLADPSADRIVFWDDGDTQYEWLVANTGLSISGNNLNCDITQYTDAMATTQADAKITVECASGQTIDNAIDALILTHKNIAAAHHSKWTTADTEGVITAELVDGQSIDNRIDALITTHTAIEAAHGMEHNDLTDTSLTGPAIEDLHVFGSTNYSWVPCIFAGEISDPTSHGFTGMTHRNINTDDSYWYFTLPLPPVKQSYKLHVAGLRIDLYAADASNYVNNVGAYGLDYNTITSFLESDTNRTTQGQYDYPFGPDDCSTFSVVRVYVRGFFTTAGNFRLASVSLKCYYTA